MAMRAATMSPMSLVDASPTLREPGDLFRKLVLLLLLITAATLWIVILFKHQTNFPLLLSTFFADASLGLIAGFGSRFVLHQRGRFIQYLIAIAAAVIGMIMIGYLTEWVLGIGPIELEPKTVGQIRQITFDRNPLDQIRSMKIDSRRLLDLRMDWADPIHLAISLVMTVLSLQAWRRPASTLQPVEVEVVPLPQPPPTTRAIRSKRGRRASSSSNGGARVELPGSWSTRLRPDPPPRPRTRSNNGSRSTVLKEPKKTKDQVVRPKRRRSRRKPQIQFALVEEHRCPYCLDAVTHHDPRGVKECDVCHTLHHADCWAITGFCQVPHLNT